MRGTKWVIACVFGAVLLAGSATAWAGELKIGAAPLEVDGKGKLTQDARGKTVTEMESSVPGDELWALFLWAKIDGGVAGPLYLEFYRDHKGKQLVAQRYEYPDYGGEKYITMEIEIGRSEGFRTDETVDLAFVQNVGGRDVKKAKAKLKLLKSSKPMPKDEPAGEEEDEEPDPLDGPDEDDAEPVADPEPEPPPIEPEAKKGCTVGAVGATPWFALLGFAAVRRRSRR